MHMITDAAKGVAGAPLQMLERRAAAAREMRSSGRDVEFIRRQLPTVEAAMRYFAPEVRHPERLPATGPVLVVGNHSGLFYMPDMWITAIALVRRRGLDAPAFGLGYDLLFAIPGVESVIRRFGALPASGQAAEQALAEDAAVLVYPGGDWEACRPWTQRNRVDLHGRTGFVRLALRTGAAVVPVVAHGAHHSVMVLTRGERIARTTSPRPTSCSRSSAPTAVGAPSCSPSAPSRSRSAGRCWRRCAPTSTRRQGRPPRWDSSLRPRERPGCPPAWRPSVPSSSSCSRRTGSR